MKKSKQNYRKQNKNIIKENLIDTAKKKNGLIFYIIIAFVVPVLLYLQTINFGFTHFDDDGIISKNITFLSNFGNAPKAFMTDAFIVTDTSFVNNGSFYRPMQTLSYMIDIQLSGGNATWIFHLSNIILLGLIACLIFLLLSQFLIPPKLSLLSTLIFCANPLFVSSIAWIPARGDLQLTFFSLLSFIFFIEFFRKRKIIYLLLNWITFTIALFCKETAAFLPFLFIIYYFTFLSKKRFDKKCLFSLLFYAVSGIFWFWLRFRAVGGILNHNKAVGLMPILTNLPTIPESLTKFFLPFDIAPIPGFSILKTLAGFGIIVIIIILFFKNKERSKKEKIFCFSWFIILMLPPMLYKHHLIDYLDHRFFLPLIGILLFLLFSFPKNWFEKGDIKRLWLLIAIFIFLSSFTFIKSRSYSDPMTFYNSAIHQNPNSALAYFNRGNIKKDRSDFQGAIEDYNMVIALRPNYAIAYNNRGEIKANMNDFTGAIEDYNKAIAINQIYAEAYNNKGIAMASTENLNEAIINFNKAIEINPNNLDMYFNRAITKYQLKDLIGAIEDCEKVLKLNSNDQNALNLKTKAQAELQKKK